MLDKLTVLSRACERLRPGFFRVTGIYWYALFRTDHTSGRTYVDMVAYPNDIMQPTAEQIIDDTATPDFTFDRDAVVRQIGGVDDAVLMRLKQV